MNSSFTGGTTPRTPTRPISTGAGLVIGRQYNDRENILTPREPLPRSPVLCSSAWVEGGGPKGDEQPFRVGYSRSARQVQSAFAGGPKGEEQPLRVGYGRSANAFAGGLKGEEKPFRVGYARRARLVQSAFATNDLSARLRRMEQVLQDMNICSNTRFDHDVAAIRKEVALLRATARCREEQMLREQGIAKRAWAAQLDNYNNWLTKVDKQERELAAIRIQKHMRSKLTRKRFHMMSTAFTVQSCLLDAKFDARHDYVNANGEVDLTKSKYWVPHFMWICDIAELRGEGNNDFLFLADISTSGCVSDKAPKRGGRCIFEMVMYDIQTFTPDDQPDGSIQFTLKFGVNTKERKDVPKGWGIGFDVKVTSCAGRYQGTCKSNWWGTRQVTLIQYSALSPDELETYPDLIAKYYRSIA